jgi:hypothetical protein
MSDQEIEDLVIKLEEEEEEEDTRDIFEAGEHGNPPYGEPRGFVTGTDLMSHESPMTLDSIYKDNYLQIDVPNLIKNNYHNYEPFLNHLDSQLQIMCHNYRGTFCKLSLEFRGLIFGFNKPAEVAVYLVRYLNCIQMQNILPERTFGKDYNLASVKWQATILADGILNRLLLFPYAKYGITNQNQQN